MINNKSSLFFAVRKYLELSQEEMAKFFDFSQSKIARIENGKTQIWDHEWTAFLKRINVKEEGNPNFYIQSTETLDSLFKKIHHTQRSSFNSSIKMRTLSTTLNFINSELGKEKILNEILKDFPLFKQFHQIMDFKIHPIYFEQFSNQLIAENLFDYDSFTEISKFHTQVGFMSSESQFILKQQINPIDKVASLCNRSHDYVDYEYYSFKKMPDSFIIRKHYHIPRSYQLNSICNYETYYIEQMANHGLTSSSFACSKTKCYFKGDDHCEYHLKG